MSRVTTNDLLFLGIKSHVVALEKSSGREIWRTQLKGGFSIGDRFVVLLAETDRLFAHTKGELFCLAPLSGELLWHNPLPGLSYDLASLATLHGGASPSAVKKKRDAANDSRQPDPSPQIF